jgi:transglutaminase-like putative cysteine protease
MRSWLVPLLWLSSLALVATAQPPRSADPPPIVIRPQRPGEMPDTDKYPQDKNGFHVIRPSGKSATTTQVTDPKSPPPVATAGVMNVPPPGPDAGKEKTQFDYWFVVGIEGQRAGYVNWSATEVASERSEKTFIRGLRYLNLTISRFGQTMNQWGEESDVESPAGIVHYTSMRQGLSKDQALVLTGEVKGDKLKFRSEGAIQKESEIPWSEGVVGLVREPKLFKELNLKAGESFSYPSYIPTVNWVVRTTVTYEGEETKALWPNTPAVKLRRFITKPDPIEKVRLPASITWVDAETYQPLLMETDFPALGGRLTFLRTTREAAQIPVTRPVEIFNANAIRLNREIWGIHGKSAAVYKVTAMRDDEPETVFATDARQEVKNLDPKAKTFELHVSASRGPVRGATAQPAPGKEFVESNFFINWDNPLVKQQAARALAGVPAGASDWQKAVAIERWVKENMRAFEFSQSMATADNVAKTLSGDCKQYAMLSAAMCRAAGIPSRTALGVVCAEGKKAMAYHMWFEVYADGQWLPLDATLGLGGIGPGHIKITDSSWYGEKTFAPLIPVLRALSAKPTMEVVKVEP